MANKSAFIFFLFSLFFSSGNGRTALWASAGVRRRGVWGRGGVRGRGRGAGDGGVEVGVLFEGGLHGTALERLGWTVVVYHAAVCLSLATE